MNFMGKPGFLLLTFFATLLYPLHQSLNRDKVETKMRYITVFSVLTVIAVSLLALQGQETDQDSLNVRQVYQRMEQDSTLILLDVRTEQEFSGELGHLPGAILIPLDELEARKRNWRNTARIRSW